MAWRNLWTLACGGLPRLNSRLSRGTLTTRLRRLRRRNFYSLSRVPIEPLEPRHMLATVSVVATDPNAAEVGADTGLFTFTRSPPEMTALVVNFTVGGAATNTTDYSTISSSVTIQPYQTSATVTISPINDGVSESDETVILTLGSGGYTIGSPSSATVTIADGPTVSVEALVPQTAELGEPGKFRLQRTGNTSQSLTVTFTVGGTATAGSDYASLGSSVTFNANVTSLDLNVVPYADNLPESPETVILTLSGGASATVTIKDPIPKATIGATDDTATEAGPTSGQFTVSFSTASVSDVTVNYSIGGTATSGGDYQALSGTVTILANSTTATINVAPLTDSIPEAAETVIVTLTSGADYELGTTTSATISIVDDPPPIPVNAGNDASILEGGAFSANVSFTDPLGEWWTALVDFGDGTSPQSFNLNEEGSFPLSHVYAENCQYTLTVTVTASNGRSGTDTVLVSVQNVTPVVSAGTNTTVSLGSAFSSSGTFTDQGADSWTATVNYGVGQGDEPLTLLSDKSFSLNRTYPASGTYNVTVKVLDDDAAEGIASFTVQVNAPPALDLDADGSGTGFSTTWIEDAGAVPIADVDAVVSDLDGTQLGSLTVRLTNAVDAEEVLTAVVAGTSIQAAFDRGVLRLTGQDTLANYAQVLRSVRYNNAAFGPTAHARTIEVVANDGFNDSSTTTATIAVQLVNDAPIADGGPLTLGKNMNSSIVLGNDGDGEVAQPLTLTIVTAPVHGTLSGFNPLTGEIWFAPEPEYSGSDNFRYFLTDDATAGAPANLSSATVTRALTIQRLNALPEASALEANATEDEALVLTLQGNDGESDLTQSLTFVIEAQPLHGTLTNFNPATGAVTYTPQANYVGADSFTFSVTDDASVGGPALTSFAAEVTIAVADVNDPPVVANITAGVGKDTPTSLALGHDGDADAAQSLTLLVIEAPSHGTLSGFDAIAGRILYTPATGYTGSDSFRFLLQDDGNLTSSEAVVTIAVGVLPVANAFSTTTPEDTAAAVTLIGDDGDSTAVVPLTFTVVSGPAHGTLSDFNPVTGQGTYSPDTDYNGIDTFTFVVSYTTGSGAVVLSAPAAATLTVTAVNDRPLEEVAALLIGKGEPQVLLLGSDGDPEATQQLTLTVVAAPSHGTLSNFNPTTGQVTYTPAADYTGTDVFTFTLTDDSAAGSPTGLVSEAGEFSFTIKTRPVAQAQNVTLAEDVVTTLTLTSQRGDSSATLRYDLVAQPEFGTISDFDPMAGTFKYTPSPDIHGTDSLRFVAVETGLEEDSGPLESNPATISFTVSAVNDEPVAAPQEVSLGKGGSSDIVLTGDGRDPEVAQTLVYTIASQPAHGTITGFNAETGALTYTPDPAYHGTDSFTFTVTDDATAGGVARTSPAATVALTIGAPPTATAASVTTAEDTAVTLTLTGADGDTQSPALLKFLIAAAPAHGTLSAIDPLTGSVTYTPDADYTGIDSFQYSVVDELAAPGLAIGGAPAVICITVSAVNDAPRSSAQAVAVAESTPVLIVLGDDGDPDAAQSLTLTVLTAPTHGTLSDFDAAEGTLVYTPAEGYTGSDSFGYQLTDAGSLVGPAATVTLNVTTVNHAPAATAQTVTTAEDVAVSITLSGSDGDAGAEQTLTYEIVEFPEHGQLSNFDAQTGTVTYTPDANYNGPDSFRFVVSDDGSVGDSGSLLSTAAIVAINVTPVNDTPSTEPLSVTGLEDRPLDILLSGDDADSELAQALTYILVTQPAHGSIFSFNPSTGAVTYYPNANYVGADSFTYSVWDDSTAGGSALLSAAQTVTIEIVAAHYSAIAESQTATTLVNQAVALDLETTGTADDVLDVTYAVVSGPSHGSLSGLNPATGELLYTPSLNYTGIDTFTFSVTDNRAGGAPTTATVLIRIRPVAAQAVAVDDAYQMRLSDGVALLDVLTNDTPGQGATIEIVGFTLPAAGTLVLEQGTGGDSDRFRYTPAAGQTGVQTFTYTVTDGGGQQSTATVTVTVNAAGITPTNGQISIGGTGFDAEIDSTFVSPVSGNLTLIQTTSGALNQSWTDPDGTTHSGSGTQSYTFTVTATQFAGGNWTYVETVTWSYDVWAGNVHAWGGFTYTLSAGQIAGAQYFHFTLTSDDNYSSTKTINDGSPAAGSITTVTAGGHEHNWMFKSKVANLAGTLGQFRHYKNSDSQFNANRSYWYNTPGGSVSGGGTINGSTHDFLNIDVVHNIPALGPATVTGTATGGGNGNTNGQYSGAGIYVRDVIAGVVVEGGSNGNRYNYSLSGGLNAALEWTLNGSGSQQGRSSSFNAHSGSGVKTESGNADGGTWTNTSTLREGGAQTNGFQASQSFVLGGAGWVVTAGTAVATGNAVSYFAHSGSGTYTKSSSSPTDSWWISGKSNDQGAQFNASTETRVSNYNGAQWITAGTGAASGASLYFRSFSGSGGYTQRVLNASGTQTGTVTGRRWEDGSTLKTNRYQTASILPAGGNTWITAGVGSGFSDVRTHGSYSGSGSYVFERITRNAKQSGAEESRTSQDSGWTMPAGGAWSLTSGSGSSHQKSDTHSSYSGSGTYTSTSSSGMGMASGPGGMGAYTGSGGGTSWTVTTITRSDSGSEEAHFVSDSQMQVLTGNWKVTSGSGSGSGKSDSSSSYSANGTYGYSTPNMSVTGSHSASGGNELHTSYDLTSNWDPNLANQVGDPGGWLTSGNSSGSNAHNAHSESSGSGTWTLSQNSGRMVSTGSGTVTEDNNSHEAGSSQWNSTLAAGAGEWVLTSGSGSASGSGGNNFSLSASGTYSSWGYMTQTWGSFRVESARHDTNSWNLRNEVVNGNWKTVSGSGSASGSTHDLTARSGTGTQSVQLQWGAVTYRTAHDSIEVNDFSHNINSTISASGAWVATGTGSGTASGSNMTQQGTQNARYSRPVAGGTITGTFDDFDINLDFYNFTSQFNLSASGEWNLISGSGNSYDGVGIGQAFSGRGTYNLSGTAPGPNGMGWSVSGTIEEKGGWDATVGEGHTWGVASGSWVDLSKTGSGTEHTFSGFSNSATGTYTRGSISGSFKRKEKDSFDSFFAFSMSGSGAAAVGWSGSGSSHESHDYTWSYSGSGAHSLEGTTGNFSENGNGGDVSSEDLLFSRSGSGSWRQTSGSSRDHAYATFFAEYSGSASYGMSGAPAGASTFSGTRNLTIREQSEFDDTDNWTYQNSQWVYASANHTKRDQFFRRAAYSGSGTYTTNFGGGSISGQISASGFDEVDSNIRERRALSGGTWSRSGGGNGRSESQTHSSYSGSGTYGYGTLSGTIQQDGQHHTNSLGLKEYKLFGSVWKAKGNGISGADGEDNASFSGSGTYARSIAGGTINGSQSESGRVHYQYNYDAQWKLGLGQQWVLVSGSGFSDGSGEYHYSSSGSGTYTKSFDGNGVLSGTASESGRADWRFDYGYDSEVVNRAWVTSGTGSESGSYSSQFQYAGSGSRSVTTTTPNGTSHDYSSLTEAGANSAGSQFTFNWQSNPSGTAWQYAATGTSSASGMFSYSSSGDSNYTYTTGNYAGGNGTISTSTGEYVRNQSESFQWQSTTNENEALANGITTRTSNTTGSGSGTGSAYSYRESSWSMQSVTTSPGYSRQSNHSSGFSMELTDTYNFTANWSRSLAANGQVTFNSSLSNHVTGGGTMSSSYGNSWTETRTMSGSGSGGGGGSTYTTSGGGNGGGTTNMPGYDLTVNYPGFYTGAYNQGRYAWSIGGVPVVYGNYSFVLPGGGGWPSSGGGSGGGGGGDPPIDPLAGGPWFPLVGGDGMGDILIVEMGGFLHQGAGGSVSFEEILGIKVNAPDPPSPYGNAFYEFLGENIIRPVVGDEALIGASDFQLFLGTAIFATVLVVGIWVAPGAVAAGAAFGAVIGAGYNIAHQLDNGATWDTLDWGQVGRGALAGGVTGAFMGAAFGIGAATIPGFCTIAQVGGAIMAAGSLYNAYNNFNQGNYYTASLDAILGFTGLYGAARGMFGRASRALGGSCFVAGTQVVRYAVIPLSPTTQSENGEAAEMRWNMPLLVLALGTFLAVGWQSVAASRRRRRPEEEEEDAHRLLFEQLAEDDPLPEDPDDEPPLGPPIGEPSQPFRELPPDPAQGKEWSQQLDALCDELFNGPADLDPTDDPWSQRELSRSTAVATPTRVARARPDTSSRYKSARQPKRDKQRARQRALPAARTEERATPLALVSRWTREPAAKLIAGLLLGATLLLLSVPWGSSVPPAEVDAAAQPAPAPQLITTNIEDIRLGDWVLAHNPVVSDEERLEAAAQMRPEDDPDRWRRVAMRLEKATGGYVDLEVLRPLDWLEQYDAKPGARVEIEVSELGVAGWADVFNIDACPPIGPPPSQDCRVVTGRFVHSSTEAFDLRIAGIEGQPDQCLGVTATHPIWSEDAQAFVKAADLVVGERLLLVSGDVTQVVSLVPRAGTEVVYNLEVDVEHVYFVSPSGLLVHNGCQGHHSDPKFMGGKVKQKLTPMGTRLHQRLHKDLAKHLKNYKNKAGRDMSPRSNNTGKQIRRNFTRDQRLQALADFYKAYQARYPAAARDFFNQHPHLR